MKPGYQSTEFWLTLLAMILGAVMASGVLSDGGLVIQIVGGALALLAKLGYTAARTSAKNTETYAKLGTLGEKKDGDTADPS